MTMWKVLVLIAAIWLGCRVCSVMLIIYSESKMVIVCLVSMFLATLLLLGTLYVHMLLFGLLHIERIAALLPADGVAHWPAALVCEGGSHHHQPAGGLHLLLGPLLSPPCPHHNLPHQPHCVCYTTHFNTHLIFIMCTSIINLLIYAFWSLELCNTFKGILCSCNSMKSTLTIARTRASSLATSWVVVLAAYRCSEAPAGLRPYLPAESPVGPLPTPRTRIKAPASRNRGSPGGATASESALAFSCGSGASSQLRKKPRPLSGQFSVGHVPSLATVKGAVSLSL
uniref:Uncharacterized protein n=1 Tax=Rangifer tarandus platyrhynchus TaxID=3082113 RepID=A0ACB0FK81_RANTA|nr:unnamed protein product [Rangifer tarandus platyrhynchus]